MEESRRQKKIASLIKETLSQILIESIQDSASALITITRVEMSKDLQTAHVHLSFFGRSNKENILELINQKKGYLRKMIASKTKLKYNPKLIFAIDPGFDHAKRINELLKK
jgi:ribosome-binding factor A